MRDKEKKENFRALEKLDLSQYKVGQYLILIDGKVVKKGWAVDKMVKSVRKKFPNKTPFIFRIQPKEPTFL